MIRQKISLATILIATLVAVATILLGVLGALNYTSERAERRAQLESQTRATCNQLSVGLALALWNFDRPEIDKVIESAMESPEVYCVVVRQRDVSSPVGTMTYGRMRDAKWGLVQPTSEPAAAPDLVVSGRQITAGGETLGSIKVFSSPRFVDAALRRNLLFAVIRILALDLLLILSLSILLRRTVILPLRDVERFASSVNYGGNLDLLDKNQHYYGELESLRSSIQKMISLLQERYAAIKKSEAMLSCILNSVPLGVFWKDLEGKYLGGNDVFARAAGVKRAQDVIGKTDFELPWPKAEAEAYCEDDRQVIATRTAKTHIVELLHQADGSELWVDTSKVPLLDGNNECFGVLGVYQDITKRRQAEEELRLNEEQIRLLIDQSLAGIIVFDVIYDDAGVAQDYRLTRANPAFDRLTGLNREKELGKTSGELAAPFPPELGRQLMKLATSGEHMFYERFNSKLGRHYEVQAFCPRRGQFALIFNDVTERKRAEALLMDSEKMRIVAGLAAGMAHEINNPLAGMVQSAQVVLNRIDPELKSNRKDAEESGITVEAVQAYLTRRRIPEMLQAIRSSGERAADIVANMLSFSRNNEGSATLHLLSDIVDQAIELAGSDYDLKKFDFRNIQLVKEYDPDMPPVSCRAAEIQQVLLNLLKNAAQAMAERKEPHDAPKITVRIQRHGDRARIEIEDNGPGMPDSVSRRIFEPFFTTKAPQTGTGLGLFVSYCIITRNHGGTIEVHSSNDKGTRFTIELPIEKEKSS